MSLTFDDEAPAPPVLVQLCSAHGLMLAARRADGVLCQVADGFDAGLYSAVVGMIPHRHGEMVFLAAVEPGAPLALSMAGEAAACAALSYRVSPAEEEGRFLLRNPSTGCYLSASAPAELPADVAADRDAAGGWEQWEFVSVAAEVPPVLAALAASDAAVAGPAEAEFLRGFARLPPVLALPALAAYGRLMSRDLLRRQMPWIAKLDGYDAMFPAFRTAFAGRDPAFGFDSRTLMRAGIERFGWQIGAHSYGAPEVIDAEYGSLSIGRYCSMAGGVQLIVANHETRTATTYPFAALRQWWPSALDELTDHPRGEIAIGHAVWIGAGACVLPGSRIGHGSVIGARAVVHGEVPPYSVYVGNPGRVARRLHDEPTIARLLALAWWDWPDAKVDRFVPLLAGEDVGAFLDAAEPAVVPRAPASASTQAVAAAPAEPAPKTRPGLFGRLKPFG